MASALINMGIAAMEAGFPDQAIGYQRQAVAYYQASGLASSEAAARTNIGYIHLLLGQPAEAIQESAAAIRLYRLAPSVSWGLAEVLDNISQAYLLTRLQRAGAEPRPGCCQRTQTALRPARTRGRPAPPGQTPCRHRSRRRPCGVERSRRDPPRAGRPERGRGGGTARRPRPFMMRFLASIQRPEEEASTELRAVRSKSAVDEEPGPGNSTDLQGIEFLPAVRAGRTRVDHLAAALVPQLDLRPVRCRPPVPPLAHGVDYQPQVTALRGQPVLEPRRVLRVLHPAQHPVVDKSAWPLHVRMFREMPRRTWKSSNLRTPRNASLTMSRLHHSPTTSRHLATEQVMYSKLVRCIR